MNNNGRIGDNNPPSPFEDAQGRISDLYDEATLWLDGEVVDNEASAKGIAKLLNMLRKAGKDADDLRREEKKPHDDAAKDVQAKFKPLSDRVRLATDACKKALNPWLVKKEAEKREKEAELRKKAEDAERKAREARQSSQADNLASQEALAKAEEAANKAKAISVKTQNASGGVKPTFGRAISLRTKFVPVLINPIKAAEHFWTTKNVRVTEFLQKLAEEDVRSGKRSIPGFEINEERGAV